MCTPNFVDARKQNGWILSGKEHSEPFGELSFFTGEIAEPGKRGDFVPAKQRFSKEANPTHGRLE